MGFTITLYNEANDKRVVSKTLGTPIATFTDAVARDSFGVRSGDITITTDTDISKVNYCHISELNRYYYVTDITILRTGVWLLSLRCDVLMTFSGGIRALRGTVDRQENKYNGYIPDGQYKELAYSQITAKAFPNAMNRDTLILMTVG